jgi:hypothetical protein
VQKALMNNKIRGLSRERWWKEEKEQDRKGARYIASQKRSSVIIKHQFATNVKKLQYLFVHGRSKF